MNLLAEKLYVAYCNKSGWKSLVSGAPLPQWHSLSQPIKDAWIAVALASRQEHLRLPIDRRGLDQQGSFYS